MSKSTVRQLSLYFLFVLSSQCSFHSSHKELLCTTNAQRRMRNRYLKPEKKSQQGKHSVQYFISKSAGGQLLLCVAFLKACYHSQSATTHPNLAVGSRQNEHDIKSQGTALLFINHDKVTYLKTKECLSHLESATKVETVVVC